MHLCTFFLMKSYGQRCIRMPPLRGGQSLVHLCLTATIKAPLRGAPTIRYWSVGRTGTRRALVGGKARASRSLRHRSIVSRRRTEGFALATRAARCSLRSHSPLLPRRRLYVLALCRSPEISTGSAGSRFARPAGRSLVPSYGRYVYRGQVGGRCRSRTNSLATLAPFVEVPSVGRKNVPVAPQP
jgi:hypothetical protein